VFVDCYSQNDKTYTSIEIGGFISDSLNTIPFWQRSNQNGVFQRGSNKFYLTNKFLVKFDTTNRKLQFQIGYQILGYPGTVKEVFVPELYVRIKRESVYFTLGRKANFLGFADTTMTSGSISWSNTALPIPALNISLDSYQKLKFDFLYFKGHISNGWFFDQKSVNGSFLHQKSIYFRFGKPTNRILLYSGILHHVQWGGTPNYTVPTEDSRFLNKRFSSDFVTYLNVFFPLSRPPEIPSIYSKYDLENRIGNHNGQFDFGGSIDYPFSVLSFYKQTYFETGQTFSSLTNIDDGLFGFSYASKLTHPKLKRFAIEFVNTTNQGIYRPGLLRLIGFHGRHYGTNQNYYFNHGQYLDGWSYNGVGLGTPFIIPNVDLKSYKGENVVQTFSYNNRVKVLYLSFENHFKGIILNTKLSFSENFGSSRNDFYFGNQFSAGMNIKHKFTKSNAAINLNIGIDRGELINNVSGIKISTIKHF
jgi:hypothetical protein